MGPLLHQATLTETSSQGINGERKMKKRELALETAKGILFPVVAMILIVSLPFASAGLI